MDNNQIKNKIVQDKNKEIILNVALILNKELFNDNEISYKMYKTVEEGILKQIKKI